MYNILCHMSNVRSFIDSPWVLMKEPFFLQYIVPLTRVLQGQTEHSSTCSPLCKQDAKNKQYLGRANPNQMRHSLLSVTPLVRMIGVKTFTFCLREDTLLPLSPHPAQQIRILTPNESPTPEGGSVPATYMLLTARY